MKYFLLLFLVALSFISVAQAPYTINYQAGLRDPGGLPIAQRVISLRFEVLENSLTGPVVFDETQSNLTTNSFGLVSTRIGKNTPLSTVTWKNGPYFLRVSVDPAGGQNFAVYGTQEISSVPFALSTPPPVLSYSTDVLTVNGSTVLIAQPAGITISGGSNVSVSAGPDYSISVNPTLALNGGSISISGGNSVLLPSSTITGSGLATVNPTAGTTFVVNVPAPTYSANGVLSFGNYNLNILPQLVLNSGTLSLGGSGSGVPFPAAVTVTGSGVAAVSGGPNYTVNVPAQLLTYNANTGSLSISGGNNIQLPPFQPATNITQSGIANVTTTGPNNFNVAVPLPVYNASTGILSFGGSNLATVIPSLGLTGGTLTVGPSSNSVDVTAGLPWTDAVNAVTLTTGTDRVGIGSNASIPGAKLDVQGENTLTVPVIKVVNTNAANASGAVDIATSGGAGLNVVNNSAGGLGASFNSAQGIAISANNNSPLETLHATNVNTLSGSYAGFFDGGFVSKGKGAPTNFIISARNSNTSADVFVVRNDGNVGIGTNTPSQKLDVAGSVKITDGTEGFGKVLTSDVSGNASWQPVSLITTASFNSRNVSSAGTTPTVFATPLTTFTKTLTGTRVEVTVQTHIMVEDLNGLNGVSFEIRLNNNQPLNNTGRTTYFKDNNLAATKNDFAQVTMVAEFASGLPAGSYNVNVSVLGIGGAGTATDVWLDPGNYSASSVIIKEQR